MHANLANTAPMLARRYAGTWLVEPGHQVLARRAARVDERIDLLNALSELALEAPEAEVDGLAGWDTADDWDLGVDWASNDLALLPEPTDQDILDAWTDYEASQPAPEAAPSIYGTDWSPECFGFGFTVSARPAGSVCR